MRAILCLLSTTLWAPSIPIQDYKAGDLVVVVAAVPLQEGEEHVGDAWPGLVFRVVAVNADSVRMHEENAVWIEKRHVMPMGRPAADRLTVLLRESPQNSALYYGRSVVWMSLRELDKAVADANESIRIEPSEGAYGLRAYVWEAKKEYDKAISDYDELLRMNPENSAVLRRRGDCKQAKKDLDGALADFNAAIDLDPTAENYYERASFWLWSDKIDLARGIKDLDEAIRLDSKFVRAYYFRGSAHRRRGEYAKATADFDSTLRVDPRFALAHYGRGVTHLILRDPAATGEFRKYLALASPADNSVIYAHIKGHFAARLCGEPAEARKFLDDANDKWKSKDEWPKPVIEYLRGELDEADMLAKALDQDEKTEAHGYLGLDHLAHGRKAEAREHFEWVKEHGNRTFYEYEISLVELRRMAKQKP